MYLAYLLTFFLAFYLVYLWIFFVAEVRRVTIQRLLFGSGGKHCDLALAVEVRRRRRRRRQRDS